MVAICTSHFKNALFYVYGICMILSVLTEIISLNSVKKLMLVMVTGCVLFEVRAEFVNIT
jgi:hypothetical protein